MVIASLRHSLRRQVVLKFGSPSNLLNSLDVVRENIVSVKPSTPNRLKGMKDQLKAKFSSTTNEHNVDYGGFGESSDLKMEGTQKKKSVSTSSDICSSRIASLPIAKGNNNKLNGEKNLNCQLE